MSVNYEDLGFKCGLEIHQQLEGKKLFCDCPTLNSGRQADIKAERKLKAVAGETGEVDVAARYEMSKQKRFFYESSSENTCLVEYDEEPPHITNKNALETAMKIALLLNCKIVDEIQVMRKTVVDGSNVSGFQRTALIAMDGFVESSLGKVTIPTICLEEEAAQKLEEGNDFVKYNLDRLGIPLIEIATGADIKSAEHAKEVAFGIGMILRSVEGVKRGIGTIRQDVNISVKGGARTEIKGFQDLRSISRVIDFEVRRQLDSIKRGEKPRKEVRKAEPDFTTSFLRPIPGAARLYPETDVLPVRIERAYAERLQKSLPKLLSEKAGEISEKYKIGRDLAKDVLGISYFEEFVKKFNKIEPSAIANIVVNIPKEIKTRFNLDSSTLKENDFEQVLNYLNEEKITKEAVIELLSRKIKGEKIVLSHFELISDDKLENEIKKIISEKPGLNASAYMGIVMAKHRGKVEGRKVMEFLKKHIK